MVTQDDHVSRSLRIKQRVPLNAEPDVAELVEFPITPESLIYNRNHSAINQFDPATFTLRVDGEVARTLQFTLHDLMHAFAHRNVVAAMQCAGNRRKAMVDRLRKGVEGILWGEGVVANVRWTGVALRDVFLCAGIPQAASTGMHACFSSHAAACEDDEFFGGSIPLATALDEEGDVLIAFAVHERTPAACESRVPLPDSRPRLEAGVRWVKWVDRITVSHAESPNFYQQQDYKILPASVQTHVQATAEAWWARVPPLQMSPLNSAIASARVLPSAPAPTVFAKGYAVRGPGGQVRSVVLSADRGRSWAPAHITYQEGRWSWTLWEAALVVPRPAGGKLVLWSRATDESGIEQMPECDWNLRGMAYSAIGEYTIEL